MTSTAADRPPTVASPTADGRSPGPSRTDRDRGGPILTSVRLSSPTPPDPTTRPTRPGFRPESLTDCPAGSLEEIDCASEILRHKNGPGGYYYARLFDNSVDRMPRGSRPGTAFLSRRVTSMHAGFIVCPCPVVRLSRGGAPPPKGRFVTQQKRRNKPNPAKMAVASRTVGETRTEQTSPSPSEPTATKQSQWQHGIDRVIVWSRPCWLQRDETDGETKPTSVQQPRPMKLSSDTEVAA